MHHGGNGRGPGSLPSAQGSSIGVVVATYNRVDSLLHTLERLTALPEQPRVVVVDNGSGDGTAAAVRRRFDAVRVIALPRNVGTRARTIGARVLDTPYVAFNDDDSWWAPGALARGAAALAGSPRLALVAARVLVGPDGRDDATCVAMARSPLPLQPGLPGRPVLGFVACGAIVRRSAFLAVGGFQSRLLVSAEERLLALDLATAGWALAYLPEVVAHHHPSPLRDPNARRRLEARNRLWIAWLRRPWPSAARETASAVRLAARDRNSLAGVVGACAGLPWVIRERRPVAAELELQLRAVDAGR